MSVDNTEANGATDALREQVKTLAVDDPETHKDFAMCAVKKALKIIEQNRKDAKRMGHDVAPSAEHVICPNNVRDIEVRAKPYENPRVTIWLTDCPTWANHAERATLHPKGLNAYNGKVTTTIDVRPF